jgi:exopolyphosphatase/guanosine-5'-triphosphate,3'-diphosphate pyrophosphatase
VTEMTLRDGLLVDLVSRWNREDPLAGQVKLPRVLRPRHLGEDRALLGDLEKLAHHYHVDISHARHTAQLACSVFDQMRAQGVALGDDERRLLMASSFLHDIGRIVSDAGHQRHSAYLIRHSHLPGFSPLDMKKCALVALFHRKELPPKKDLPFGVSGSHADQVRRMTAILRLVDGLDEDRTQNIASVSVKIEKRQASLELWQIHPTTLNMNYFRYKSAYFEELFDLRIISFVHPWRQARAS